MNWNSLGGLIGKGTDWLGISDTGAQQRGLDTLTGQMNTATAGLDQSMLPVFNMYNTAMQGRQMGDVLGEYDKNMAAAANAGAESNVTNYMNPMAGRMGQSTANAVRTGAGSSLQSSAANNAMASAMGQQQAQLWNTAFQQALADSQNNQNIYNQKAQTDLMPSLNWAQLTSDVAGSKFDADTALANAAGQVAGQNQGWFSSLFNGVF